MNAASAPLRLPTTSAGLVRSTLADQSAARTVSISRPLPGQPRLRRCSVWVLPLSEAEAPSLRRLLLTLLIIGATSFGGGMGAYLREYLVNRLRFLSEEDYLVAMEISQTLPGINSANLAVIVGDRFGGVRGALLAPLALLLPGAFCIGFMGYGYSHLSGDSSILALTRAAVAAAVGLPIAMTMQMTQKHVNTALEFALATLTFAAIAWFKISLPLILLTLGPVSIWLHRPGARR